MSGDTDKPIVLTHHAKDRLLLRGATADEVTKTLRDAEWKPAKRGKWHAARRFDFAAPSPINGLFYAYKTVDVVFADEPTRIVVLTVKVFYHD